MVQIRRTRPEKCMEREESTANHRLLYSKSKVYVNPTPYTRDNIPGFVALVKKVRRIRGISIISTNPFDKGSDQPYLSVGLDPRKLAR